MRNGTGPNQVLAEPITGFGHEGVMAESIAIGASKVSHCDGVEAEMYLIEDLQIGAGKSRIEQRIHKICVASTKEGRIRKVLKHPNSMRFCKFPSRFVPR